MPHKPRLAVVSFDEWLMNVHDVFMNAQLMRTLMDREPVVHGADEFMTSPRGRLERCAMRDLSVLIEAYRASPRSYLDELARLVPDEHEHVEQLLKDQARVDALREVRDYMSHRDVRRYYDSGRISPAIIGPQWYQRVESAFAKMLLLAIRSKSARS